MKEKIIKIIGKTLFVIFGVIFLLFIFGIIMTYLYTTNKKIDICESMYCKNGIDCEFSPQYNNCINDNKTIVD